MASSCTCREGRGSTKPMGPFCSCHQGLGRGRKRLSQATPRGSLPLRGLPSPEWAGTVMVGGRGPAVHTLGAGCSLETDSWRGSCRNSEVKALPGALQVDQQSRKVPGMEQHAPSFTYDTHPWILRAQDLKPGCLSSNLLLPLL